MTKVSINFTGNDKVYIFYLTNGQKQALLTNQYSLIECVNYEKKRAFINSDNINCFTMEEVEQ